MITRPVCNPLEGLSADHAAVLHASAPFAKETHVPARFRESKVSKKS